MYTYHVFGVIAEETYYFMNNRRSYCSDYMYREDKWLEDVYNITRKTTSDYMFERIKENNRYLSIEDKQYHYCKKIKIPKYILE